MSSTDGSAQGSKATGLQDIFKLLQTKDDTSRFVGLSLLRSYLDTHEDIRKNIDVVAQCWDAIPLKFLFRLLRAEANSKRSLEEAQSMIQLSASVIHVFSIILPARYLEEPRFLALCDFIVRALPKANDQTMELLLQTLLSLASTPKGADQILLVDDLSPLVEICSQRQLALQTLETTLIRTNGGGNETRDRWKNLITQLIATYRNSNAYPLLKALATTFGQVEVSGNESWLQEIVGMCQQTIVSSPTPEVISASARIIASLPNSDPSFPNPFKPLPQITTDSTKPLSYLFSSILIAEIQSTIPSLMETLASDSYSSTAISLSACLDTLTLFIRTLISTSDDDDAAVADLMSPSLLLKLHKDLSQTMALLLEYLRDRWDASHAGASGLHPDARTAPEVRPGERAPLSLTWENPTMEVAGDPIVIAAIRCLGCWVRDDEDRNLRKQAAGCMDMFLALFKQSSEGSDGVADLRPSILMLLQGTLEEPWVVESFLENDGWNTLAGDLKESLRSYAGINYHALAIIGVLQIVIESEAIAQAKESWLQVLPLLSHAVGRPESQTVFAAAEVAVPDPGEVQSTLELFAQTLLSRAPTKFKARYEREVSKICGLS